MPQIDMPHVELTQWLYALQFLGVLAAGVWVLFTYTTARRSQTQVSISHDARLIRDFVPGKSLLIVRVVLSNVSDVLWRRSESRVTVFDARRRAKSGGLSLVPFLEADPLLPVYGITSDDPGSISRGNTFEYFEGQEISLEPGEQVQSEVSFLLDREKLGLMAVKLWFSGFQRKLSRRPYEWAAFSYVDPEQLSQDPDWDPTTMEAP